MRPKYHKIKYILTVAALALFAGCVHGGGLQDPAGTADVDGLGPEIERTVAACQVNARALDQVYDRLHAAAADEAGRSRNDVQLGYIQRAYLYVHQARVVAAYQIRLLADYPYVSNGNRADFLTLRARDLDRGVTEMEDAAHFLAVYAAFIKDPRTQAEIEKARELISGNIYLYEKLLETIKPAVNPAAPFTRDPYSPFSRGI